MGIVASTPIEVMRVQKQRGHIASAAVAELQGYRDSHEDAHFMNQPDANGWGNFGVLDGHGGSQAARLGAQLLPLAMKKHTKGRKPRDGPGPGKLKEAFEEVDAELATKMGSGQFDSGTTVVTGGCKLGPDGYYTAYIANAGDSRGMIIKMMNPPADAPATVGSCYVPKSRRATASNVPGGENDAKDGKAADDASDAASSDSTRPPSSEGGVVAGSAAAGSEGEHSQANDGAVVATTNKDPPVYPLHRTDVLAHTLEVNLTPRIISSLPETVRRGPWRPSGIAERIAEIGDASSGAEDKEGKEEGAAAEENGSKEGEEEKKEESDLEEEEGLNVRLKSNVPPRGLTKQVQVITSIDHKPDRKDERHRIEKANGFVTGVKGGPDGLRTQMLRHMQGMKDEEDEEEEAEEDQEEPADPSDAYWARDKKKDAAAMDCPRLDGNLAVSRGLADFQYKQVEGENGAKLLPKDQKVSCVPELFQMHGLEKGDLIVLACDGIFDVMSNCDVVDMVVGELAGYEVLGQKMRREDMLAEICQKVITRCLKEESRDNMTFMIIQIGPPTPDTPEGVENPTHVSLLDEEVIARWKQPTNEEEGAQDSRRDSISSSGSAGDGALTKQDPDGDAKMGEPLEDSSLGEEEDEDATKKKGYQGEGGQVLVLGGKTAATGGAEEDGGAEPAVDPAAEEPAGGPVGEKTSTADTNHFSKKGKQLPTLEQTLFLNDPVAVKQQLSEDRPARRNYARFVDWCREEGVTEVPAYIADALFLDKPDSDDEGNNGKGRGKGGNKGNGATAISTEQILELVGGRGGAFGGGPPGSGPPRTGFGKGGAPMGFSAAPMEDDDEPGNSNARGKGLGGAFRIVDIPKTPLQNSNVRGKGLGGAFRIVDSGTRRSPPQPREVDPSELPTAAVSAEGAAPQEGGTAERGSSEGVHNNPPDGEIEDLETSLNTGAKKTKKSKKNLK